MPTDLATVWCDYYNIMKTYAGIGSRKAPEEILSICTKIGSYLGFSYVLRSGGAVGCDSAFEMGCDIVNGLKEIYLPWSGFNNKSSKFIRPTTEAISIASSLSKNWSGMKPQTKWLFARNVHQILGIDCNSPSDFVVFWSKPEVTESRPHGCIVGGTGFAIKIADKFKVPHYNLFDQDQALKLKIILEKELPKTKH